MKIATTIQFSTEENQEISRLKKNLHLPSKKAVVLEGLAQLQKMLQEIKLTERLKKASALVREDSIRTNRSWSPLASALKKS